MESGHRLIGGLGRIGCGVRVGAERRLPAFHIGLVRVPTNAGLVLAGGKDLSTWTDGETGKPIPLRLTIGAESSPHGAAAVEAVPCRGCVADLGNRLSHCEHSTDQGGSLG